MSLGNYTIYYDINESNIQLIHKTKESKKILDESIIPKDYINAHSLAVIKAAFLAIKNNVKVFNMEGWPDNISSKVDYWFGKSIPLKFKYVDKNNDFWIQSCQELLDKSFLTNGWELLEKAIIYIFGAIDKIYITNPEAINVSVEKLNYSFEVYDSQVNIDEQLDEYNLFTDASVKEAINKVIIAGYIKDKTNNVLCMYKKYVCYDLYKDSNIAEMHAIAYGIGIANLMEIKKIKIFTDSMCSIEKIQQYSPYYKSLFSDNTEEIIKNIKKLNHCKFVHINRHLNKLADSLTNIL